jgi:hypothetical protein
MTSWTIAYKCGTLNIAFVNLIRSFIFLSFKIKITANMKRITLQRHSGLLQNRYDRRIVPDHYFIKRNHDVHLPAWSKSIPNLSMSTRTHAIPSLWAMLQRSELWLRLQKAPISNTISNTSIAVGCLSCFSHFVWYCFELSLNGLLLCPQKFTNPKSSTL